MSVNWSVYLPLSLMMFLEYAVWGAWAPVLAARLLGPLKMSGKQTGWIYATLPLASMVSPLVAGQLADKYLDTGWVLAAAHLIGAVLMFIAITRKTFASLFVTMLLYSMCYAATIPLVNSLMFRHLEAAGVGSDKVFIWAPVAWALVGYLLTGWRMARGGEGEGSDCLVFAAVLSVLMAGVCLVQPATPPDPTAQGGTPIVQAFSMLQDLDFAVFIGVSLFVAGMMQFYFLGTAQFMQDRGVSGKGVPAAMAIAQAAQALATLFLLSLFWKELGPKWTLTIGAGSWAVLYVVYTLTQSRPLIVGSQMFHGLAYVFFIIAGQMFVNEVAPKSIASSAQALIILVTTGIGLFLGTQAAGIIMDHFKAEGKFQWRKIWTVPLLVVLVGTLLLASPLFRGTIPPSKAAPKPASSSESRADAGRSAPASLAITDRS